MDDQDARQRAGSLFQTQIDVDAGSARPVYATHVAPRPHQPTSSCVPDATDFCCVRGLFAEENGHGWEPPIGVGDTCAAAHRAGVRGAGVDGGAPGLRDRLDVAASATGGARTAIGTTAGAACGRLPTRDCLGGKAQICPPGAHRMAVCPVRSVPPTARSTELALVAGTDVRAPDAGAGGERVWGADHGGRRRPRPRVCDQAPSRKRGAHEPRNDLPDARSARTLAPCNAPAGRMRSCSPGIQAKSGR